MQGKHNDLNIDDLAINFFLYFIDTIFIACEIFFKETFSNILKEVFLRLYVTSFVLWVRSSYLYWRFFCVSIDFLLYFADKETRNSGKDNKRNKIRYFIIFLPKNYL